MNHYLARKLNMNGTFLILWLLMDAAIVYGSKDIRKCNTVNALSGENACPASSICRENQIDSKDGVCICKNESFTFNPNYKNNSDYCMLKLTNDGTSNSNTNPNSNSNSNLDIEPNERNSNSDNRKYEHENYKNDHIITNDDNKQQISPLPGAKHVAAGIFFPIISVIILIGGIFAYKKLHITQRIRNFRRNRRSRPFYGDVSLEENSQRAAPKVYYVDDTEQLASF